MSRPPRYASPGRAHIDSRAIRCGRRRRSRNPPLDHHVCVFGPTSAAYRARRFRRARGDGAGAVRRFAARFGASADGCSRAPCRVTGGIRGECVARGRIVHRQPTIRDWRMCVGESMTWVQALILGLVQGLTEFLPISSSAHMRIVSAVFFGDDAGASFTAVTQLGTEAAVLVYFAKDIWRILVAWFTTISWKITGREPARVPLHDQPTTVLPVYRDDVPGGYVLDPDSQRDLDYRIGWYVIIATIPIGVIGFLLKDQIRTGARNLWLVSTMLIVFALVIAAAEYYGEKRRPIEQLTTRDGLIMGFAQCLALIPGVSRSGATSSAGLFIGLTREAAVRFSFLLAIPAVLASGLFSLPDAFEPAGEGLNASGPQILVATIVAFTVGYASVAWLLRFVTKHSLDWFVGYRIILGLTVMALLATGVVSAT
ncbi:undecaprenyl-diphosphate phosphatase [Nocardia sp. NPDC058058]|uniref:undecaprenyl-diphosphate phosphatase n=1 Tax=Nocardia sp. NPDC058058 TaxID=3346317 RepID=UPI0036D96C25